MVSKPEKTNEEIIQEIERMRKNASVIRGKDDGSSVPMNQFDRGVKCAFDLIEVFIAGRIRSLYDDNGDLIKGVRVDPG